MKSTKTYCRIINYIGCALVAGMLLLPGAVFSSERMAVKSSKANIRSGPGTNYDILWEVEKYHPLMIIETQDKWCRFSDFEGDIGWIYRPLLGKINAVITIRNKCNVRSGPGKDNAVLFTTDKGIPFKVMEKKDGWLQIQHADGDTGWIHQSLVW